MPHLERDFPGLLKDRGRPPRLCDEERKEGDDEGRGEGSDDGQEGGEEPDGVEDVGPKQGRVCIPSMAYLASNSKSTGVEVPGIILPAEPEIDSASDMYALKKCVRAQACAEPTKRARPFVGVRRSPGASR